MKLDGCLMSKDIAVAEIKENNLKILNEQLVPLYLKNYQKNVLKNLLR